MIESTPSPGASPGSDAVVLGSQTRPNRATKPGGDRLSLDQADALSGALSQEPEIRPDVVERGRALAADPGYPPASIVSQVAGQIASAPDLSEDPS